MWTLSNLQISLILLLPSADASTGGTKHFGMLHNTFGTSCKAIPSFWTLPTLQVGARLPCPLLFLGSLILTGRDRSKLIYSWDHLAFSISLSADCYNFNSWSSTCNYPRCFLCCTACNPPQRVQWYFSPYSLFTHHQGSICTCRQFTKTKHINFGHHSICTCVQNGPK
jgi:hypothetical protein